ncbi:MULTISPECIES: acylneuraminate cytidylyltransferase family protein [Arsenicicoccus]|uniref:Acylneuraminate cytidylyltransferase family protein n=1 Tax=Arsenicicoccus bolidensis TaxID=229480 RepID=A0ABS9Q5C2_9MICO|nr:MULTISPECIES: acylneuraminate cytidylyltransferase family protein [Arsenicicoccus]MCG7323088.1 acylneuraminate cytidylyltransferase family protein [Arsenicicoccus bolidensis]
MSSTEAPRVLAVIPARGGSKGLPGKNVRPLVGLPLIVHSIRAAGLTPGITRCIVTTDDPQIADVARANGGDVPFLRPPELATDWTPMGPVIKHALAAVEESEGAAYDALVLLDPTSPARRPEQLDEAVRRLLADDALDGVISVSEPTFQPTWVGVRETTPGAAVERYYAEGRGVTRRQDTPRYLRINGNFYAWRADFVRRLEVSWFDEGRHGMLEIPEKQAFSIDDEYEFRLIESLVTSGLLELPWIEGQA